MWSTVAFALLAVVHLLPVAPVLAPEALTRLYGVQADDTTLLVLLRHRAVLLALVGLLCLWAAASPVARPAALLAAGVNVASYLVYYGLYGAPAGPLRTVAIVDAAALVPLAVAAWTTLART